MIASINQKAFPNTLILILGPDQANQKSETKKNITRIFAEDGTTLGYNIFEINQVLEFKNEPDGQIKLTHAQLVKLNELLESVGFKGDLPLEIPDTLIYGYVKTSVPHPDSDHLHVTTVDIGRDEDVQIICGAPNIDAGQTVVVALSGTMLPDGALIWPGTIRGVESFGMITSAKELGLAHAPSKRGILVLPTDFKVGSAFEPEKIDELLANGAI